MMNIAKRHSYSRSKRQADVLMVRQIHTMQHAYKKSIKIYKNNTEITLDQFNHFINKVNFTLRTWL